MVFVYCFVKDITMSTNTKKILILGNGFDLDLGRATSYKSFYESKFCPKDYPAPIIKHLNEKWVDNLESVKWYDLENEILNYYEKIKAAGDYYDLYNAKEKEILVEINRIPTYTTFSIIQKNIDVVDRLIEDHILYNKHHFIADKEIPSSNILVHPDALLSPVERDKRAIQKIKQGLIEYLENIQHDNIKESSAAATIIRAFVSDYDNIEEYIVYNFNYMLLHSAENGNTVGVFNDMTNFIHGSIKDRNIIIGTKDHKISPDYDFIQKSFDPNFNPPGLGTDLLEADDITIFGHSLGVNDSQYFKAFFVQQSQPGAKKKTITIFTKDEKSELQIKRALQEMTDWNLSALYSMNNLQIIKTDACNDDKKILSRYVKRFCNDDYYENIIMSGNGFNIWLGHQIHQKRRNVNALPDKEVIEMLNCPVCKPVIKAIKEKREEYGSSLYEAYDSVADKYNISFGFAYIDVQKSEYRPYIIVDKDKRELDVFKTMADAQKEILRQTMYELAHRIESGANKK